MRRKDKISQFIVFPDGDEAETDLTSLFGIVDILASQYGLGSCKSLTQFTEMVNEEDPLILEGLMSAAITRIKAQNGEKQNVVYENPTVGLKNKKVYESGSNADKLLMVNFLKDMGAPKEQIAEAMAKINSGKIELPKNDFSWLNGNNISTLSKEEFEDILKKMEEDRKRGINIEVSSDTIMKKKED